MSPAKTIADLEQKIEEHLRFGHIEAQRMERIEEKINELTEAVVALARAEEKIAILIEDTRYIKQKMNESESRIHELERRNDANTNAIANFSKLFWAVITAVVTVSATAIMVALGFI